MQVGKRVYVVGGADRTGPEDGAVYLVDGGSTFAVIDAGCGRNADLLVNNITSIKPEMNAAYIVVTHGHIDHIGGLAALKR
jgi:glyoxylase-like metal-dependent hydrolase (beta-lactamase superfamily II)